ncbi:MAG: ATPase involved in replication control Cdc46/Mcm family [Candidatus Methanohalarchaeum thermophilum]|uniref:ATPase involved in replication control Cdc46/Mcm family n=1 Tax=Methanohalarchaeum thermophilum TaxID=1903181 RepID=A0A1Q6DWB2_METT1|nr:MAG: ATPase involved in replication control Cdc46/Mcm family [Candidatus Methanohalarchaeum thermophilum]
MNNRISVDDEEGLKEVVEEFLDRYYDSQGTEFTLRDLIESYPGRKHLSIDYKRLEFFDPDLADLLLVEPLVIDELEKKAREMALEKYDANLDKGFNVRVKNLPDDIYLQIRNIRQHHINRFFPIDGIVQKATQVMPQATLAVFKCEECHEIMEIRQKSETEFKSPPKCYNEKCGAGSSKIEFLEKKSEFRDFQKIKIQEPPEQLTGGEKPEDITVKAKDDLAGKVTPGNRVTVNGFVKIEKRENSRIYDPYVEANNIELEEQEFQRIEISSGDEEKIRKLSEDPQIYSKIIESMVPAVYGYSNIKEAVALQLFSGQPKKNPDGTRIRGDIHTLLIGDPGTAKSQILRYISDLAPRGVYASGKSVSAAGLTAAAVKDEFSEGAFTLEAGALVLSDQGVCAIDEFDKIEAEDLNALNDAMEQQEIAVHKAGIDSTLKTRCAVLSAANPKYGRFDEFEPIPEQLNIDPTLLSRFDLIFPITDKPDRDRDNRIAEHILNTNRLGEKRKREEVMDRNIVDEGDAEVVRVKSEIEPDLLRKYVAKARQISPVMTQEARDKLKEFYIELRNERWDSSSSVDEDPLPITARNLEALIRLGEASARTRLSDKVKLKDAERAIRIVDNCLSKVKESYSESNVSLDTIEVKKEENLSMTEKVSNVLDVIEKEFEGEAEENELIHKMKELMGIEDTEKAKKLIERAKKENRIYEPRDQVYKIV